MKILSEYKIAHDSADHLLPYGTSRDNNTNEQYIEEVEKYFDNRKIKYMDLGCAGGQLVVDFFKRGHVSVGLEGSDYGIKNNFSNWPEYNDKVLFTCDISKPFDIVNDDDSPVKFDCISSWEFLEHIHEKDLDTVFSNVVRHLNPGGVFLGSVSFRVQLPYHVSVFPKCDWNAKFFAKHFKSLEDYPFKNKVRNPRGNDSFYYFCKN